MTGTPRRLAVLASRVRTEEKRVLEVLERRGMEPQHVDTRSLHIALAGPELPWDVVLNREVSATRAVYAALSLEARGALVINTASATETCADKWRTSLLLAAAGLPTPRTVLAFGTDAARSAAAELGYPVVLKPMVGSWGRRVALLQNPAMAETIFEYCEALPNPASRVYYLQKHLGDPQRSRDIRVVVVGGRPLGAVCRQGDGWRSNVARGARTGPYPLSPELAKLAIAAAERTGAELAGVDLIEDGDGSFSVLEVNHGVEFTGFQAALGDEADVAEAIADHLATLVAA